MKHLTKIIGVGVILFLLILVHSCKKTADVPAKDPNASLRALWQQKLKDQPVTFTLMSNVAGKGYYGDLEGNPLYFPRVRDNSRTEWNCPDPSENYVDNPVSITSQFTCNQGYRLEITYLVKAEYNVLTANPNNSAQLSKGKLQLKNSSGTVIWSNTTMPMTSITVLGTENVHDPDTDTYFEVIVSQVKYITPYISETTFNNSSVARPSLFIYTDCPNVPTVNVGYSDQQSASTYDLITLPCLRVDKVWYNPSTGLGASLAGMDAVLGSCYPNNYVYPDKQEIEIYANGAWRPIRLWQWDTQGGEMYNPNGNLIDHWDTWYIEMNNYPDGSSGTFNLSAGNYQVHYRNKQTGTSHGGSCVSQPDGTWVTETWYISI